MARDEAKRDIWGVLCSGACLGHCLGTPLLLSAASLGTLTTLLQSEWLHGLLLLPVFLLFTSIIAPAYRRRRWRLQTVLGGLGCLLFALALIVSEQWEVLLSVVGGILLISAHSLNTYFRTRSHSAPDGEAPSC